MNAILIASYGTANKAALDKVIVPLTEQLKTEYPGSIIRTAFTSRILSELTGTQNPLDAVNELLADGASTISCLSLHVSCGSEYSRLKSQLSEHHYSDRILLTKPLIAGENDIVSLEKALTHILCPFNTDHIFIAHRCDEIVSHAFSKLTNVHLVSLNNMYEVTPRYNNVILHPFMMFNGRHARRDIDGILKPELEQRGFNVKCDMRGLGELDGVRDMLINKIRSLQSPA